jgi:hypothetical protein
MDGGIIQSICIASATSRRCFLSRWFAPATADAARREREKWLVRETCDDWAAALITEQVVALPPSTDGGGGDGGMAVYRAVDELLVFATGTGIFDEFALLEVVSTTIVLLCELVSKGKPLSEAALSDPAVLAKLCIALDDMVNAGQLEILDAALILRMGKLKPVELVE